MDSRKAFTLTELLVVIAIIALLMAILAPVLHRARMQAQRVSCASNIRQMGTGINLYAQDFDGLIPPMNEVRPRQTEGHYTRWFKSGDATWWNMGFVFKAGILKDGKVFYCPSPDVRFKYKNYSKPIFPSSSPLVSNPGTRMSYMYNPVCVSLENRDRKFKKLSQLKAGETLLLVDSVLDGSVAHMGGWNILVGDFSARLVYDPQMLEIIAEHRGGMGKADYEHFDQVMNLMLTQ
ncbi:MAG: type II secretion system protein [Planctomycetota bacterium]|jgi:prepilin-type N-terminal cleavage/methylation domain-containing protein